MWKAEEIEIIQLPVAAVICDTTSNQNVFYFTKRNVGAIWKLVEETGQLSVLCGSITKSAQKSGDFSVALFTCISIMKMGTNSIFVVDKVKKKDKIRKIDLEARNVSTIVRLRGVSICSMVLDQANNPIFSDSSRTEIFTLDHDGNQVSLYNATQPSSHLLMDDTFETLYVLRGTTITKISTHSWEPIEDIIVPPTTKPISDVVLDSSVNTLYGYTASNIWCFDLHKRCNKSVKTSPTGPVLYPPKGKIVMDRHGCIRVWTSQGGRRLRPPKIPWKFARLLWIGKWKNKSEDCLIAALPVDIIREIIGWNG